MLHNSGPYGPSDVPANMGAPVNKAQTGPVNLVHNLESLGKMSQDIPQIPVTQYNIQDYTPFGHHSLHIGSQVNPFSSFSHQSFGRVAAQDLHHENSVNSLQNGFLPFNFNAQNNINSNYHSQFHNRLEQREIINDFKHQDIDTRSTPLNIPQIYSKTFQNTNDIVNDSIQSFTYNISDKFMVNSRKNDNTNQNMTAIKSDPKIIKEVSSRAERIENAVKHIENIIASDMLYRKQESEQKLQNMAYLGAQEKDATSIPQENQLENFDSQNDASESSSECESDSKSPDNTTKEKESNYTSTIEIKIEQEELENDDKTTWTDTEYENPFVNDLSGVTKDKVENAKIIDGDNSVNEAVNVLKEGLEPPAAYYECPHCSLLFNHFKRFLVHVKWHSFGLTNLKRRQLAEAREIRKAIYRGEVVDNIDGEEFPCRDCDKVFSRISALKNHRTKVHKDLNRQCKICNIALSDYKAYLEHQATAHTTKTGEFECTHCNKLFKYRHTLVKHIAVHNEKIHACTQCPKRYGSQLLLREHQRTHERLEKEPAFHCSYCGKGCMDSFNLKVHERGHRNEKPFTCEICNSSFGTKATMKRHLKVSHSSSKPHICTTCHRSFSTAIIRDRHEVRAHGDPALFKYQCTQCDCKYLKANDLRKHVSKIHPKKRRTKVVESD